MPTYADVCRRQVAVLPSSAALQRLLCRTRRYSDYLLYWYKSTKANCCAGRAVWFKKVFDDSESAHTQELEEARLVRPTLTQRLLLAAPRYSDDLLYWYKSTNTDSAGAAARLQYFHIFFLTARLQYFPITDAERALLVQEYDY